MDQAARDRLVALKKAKDGKTTQRQAAEELKISERQVRRAECAAFTDQSGSSSNMGVRDQWNGEEA